MEAYESTCTKCGHKWQWVGYKSGIGKTSAQLAQMDVAGRICPQCGGVAEVDLDHTSEFGRVQDEQMGFVAGLFAGSPAKQPKEVKPMPETDTYIVIYTGGHISIEQLDKATLLDRLNDGYYGPAVAQLGGPKGELNPMYWGESVTIIKGRIIQPRAKKVVQEYDIE